LKIYTYDVNPISFFYWQSGHDDFANRTMGLLRGVMDLYRRQKEQPEDSGLLPDDISSPDNEKTTPDPGRYD
jgi:hypothetical protein